MDHGKLGLNSLFVSTAEGHVLMLTTFFSTANTGACSRLARVSDNEAFSL